jgi:hypothetical protein
MNNIVRTWKGEENIAREIELTDAELAAICGADDGDEDVPQPLEAPEPAQPAKLPRYARSAKPARTPKTLPVPQEQDSENVTSEEEEKLINLLLGLFVNS